ncbi:MAG TPA: hypothetical protein PKH24_14705 [Sedimentisphaerales bacterium]|jgi:hypothetical protein|nr:hypothetical protein [Sedimentisphaerales bacterium]HNU30614.1 hypothetical protein [Sedimentisphaerales bacterium]
MKKIAVLAEMLMLSLGAGCHERIASNRAGASVAPEEVPMLREAEDLGRRIRAHDQYAMRATSLMYSHGVDLVEMGTRGWVTESRPDGCAVTFIGGDPELWRTVCVVTFTEGEDPNLILVDKDLSETQAAMFSARQLVLGTVQTPCSGAYNTVVFPRDGQPGWLAYALAASSDPNLLLVGGHYRATVSADGQTVLEHRALTKDCLVLRNSGSAGPDHDEVAHTVPHALDVRPTEVHVFLNLVCGKPVNVVTADRRLWRIEEGRISLLVQP